MSDELTSVTIESIREQGSLGIRFVNFAVIIEGNKNQGWKFHFFLEKESEEWLRRYENKLHHFLGFGTSRFQFNLSHRKVLEIYDLVQEYLKCSENLFAIFQECVPRDILPRFGQEGDYSI